MVDFTDLPPEIVGQCLSLLRSRQHLFNAILSCRLVYDSFSNCRRRYLKDIYTSEILDLSNSHNFHWAVARVERMLQIRTEDAAILIMSAWQAMSLQGMFDYVLPLAEELATYYVRLNRLDDAQLLLETCWRATSSRGITIYILPLAEELATFYVQQDQLNDAVLVLEPCLEAMRSRGLFHHIRPLAEKLALLHERLNQTEKATAIRQLAHRSRIAINLL